MSEESRSYASRGSFERRAFRYSRTPSLAGDDGPRAPPQPVAAASAITMASRFTTVECSVAEKTKPPKHHASVAPRAAWPSVKIRQRGVDALQYCEADARWTRLRLRHSMLASGHYDVPFPGAV